MVFCDGGGGELVYWCGAKKCFCSSSSAAKQDQRLTTIRERRRTIAHVWNSLLTPTFTIARCHCAGCSGGLLLMNK
eukprot:2755660-Amphidinium_carterae.2